MLEGLLLLPQICLHCRQTRQFSGKIKSAVKSLINAPTIRRIGDPLLREEAKPVEMAYLSTPHFKEVTDKMISTMRKGESYGISAPQIGHSLQVVAYEFTGSHMKKYMQLYGSSALSTMEMRLCPLTVLVNPHIEVTDPTVLAYRETCLSMPGYSALVPRCKAIKVKGLTLDGVVLDFSVSGWIARIIQHEVDHLRGNLFVDSMLYKSLINEEWRNFRKY